MADEKTNTPPPSGAFRRAMSKLYKVVAALAPFATLLAILLTNYHSFRGYQLMKESSRAWVYVKNIEFVPGEPVKIQVFFGNAGARPADLLRHGGELLAPQLEDRSFRIREYTGPTFPTEGLIEKGGDIGMDVSSEIRLVSSATGKPITSTEEMRTILRSTQQRIYLRGRLQYFDGVESYWLPYCRLLTADHGWQTCIHNSSP